jgi:hypothetical protein
MYIYIFKDCRPRGAVVKSGGAEIWWSLRSRFESQCGTWVQVFRMRLYKPWSRVAVGDASEKNTLTAKA